MGREADVKHLLFVLAFIAAIFLIDTYSPTGFPVVMTVEDAIYQDAGVITPAAPTLTPSIITTQEELNPFTPPDDQDPPTSQSNTLVPMGINFWFEEDWVTQVARKNFRTQMRQWSDKSIILDQNGWPIDLQGKEAVSYLFVGTDGKYPSGPYTLLLSGDGTITFGADATSKTYSVSGTPKTFTVNIPRRTNNGIQIKITRTSRSNPLKFDLVQPQYVNNYKSEPFYPSFVDNLRGFEAIRFMDSFATNNNPNSQWSQRMSPTYYTKTGTCCRPPDSPSGWSYEEAFDLLDRLDANMWLNIPHQADDNYIRKLAQLTYNRLRPGQKVYVEYSNEIWNGGFWQQKWASDKAKSIGLAPRSDPEWRASQYYNGYRSTQIYDIFAQELKEKEPQLVRVLATQGGNTGVLSLSFSIIDDIKWNPKKIRPDAIATNPYFGHSIADDIVDNKEIERVTVDQILDRMLVAVDDTAKRIAADKRAATKHGVPLLTAYEGGQHVARNKDSGSKRLNQILDDKIDAANRHPRIKDVYKKLFDAWTKNDGTLFNAYLYVGQYGGGSAWGHLEYQDQDPKTSPKFQALRDAMKGGPKDKPVPVTPIPINVELNQIKPNTVSNKNLPTNIELIGSGFDKGTEIWINDKAINPNTQFVNTDKLTFMTPTSIPVGTYQFRVVRQDTKHSGQLPFTVTA